MNFKLLALSLLVLCVQVKLVQHTYSCLFGTFLCNSGKEREDRHIQERTCSMWSLLRAANRSFRNMLYSSHSETVRQLLSVYLLLITLLQIFTHKRFYEVTTDRRSGYQCPKSRYNTLMTIIYTIFLAVWEWFFFFYYFHVVAQLIWCFQNCMCIIPPVFSVTWSFRNHSNILIFIALLLNKRKKKILLTPDFCVVVYNIIRKDKHLFYTMKYKCI